MKDKNKISFWNVLLLLGLLCILGAIFIQNEDSVSRIIIGVIGLFCCLVSLSPTVRWAISGVFFVALGVSSLFLIFDDSGQFDWSYFLMAAIFIALGVFYCHKVWPMHLNLRIGKVPRISLQEIDAMSGLEFEEYTASLLKRLGYTHVLVTKSSGDQGIDVLAQKDGVNYAIQCKNYRNKLDNTPVQEACAGKVFYGCDVGVVITNSTFTKGAYELASATGVLLWDRSVLQEMIRKATRSRVPIESIIDDYPSNDPVDSPCESSSPDGSKTPAPSAESCFHTSEDTSSLYFPRTSTDSLISNLETVSGNPELDEMFPSAVDVILETGRASVSTLQRKLGLGYSRSAQVIDLMEALGIVGPYRGSQPREIWINSAQWELAHSLFCEKS